MSDLDVAIREFLVESYENLDQLERDLVNIESEPNKADLLGRIFRTVHSIKGACGFLAYPKLESVAHAGESLLCKLREGELEWSTDITSGLLVLADAIRKLLLKIESSRHEGEETHTTLINLLNELQDGEGLKDRSVRSTHQTDRPEMETHLANDDEDPQNQTVGSDDDWHCDGDESVATDDDRDAVEIGVNGVHARSPDRLEPAVKAAPPPERELRTSAHPRKASVELANHVFSTRDTDGRSHSPSIRVDVALLDKLMNLVGELVLARNQVLQHALTLENTGMLATSQRLNLITTELQEGVMKTRMQPMGNICNKFPRVVRDLSLACGKQVRFEIKGSETELDRTIIEAIKDPLTHLVRNAVDHGIEAPDERTRAGKPPVGFLLVRAFHESGQVIIEISDDGAGLNLERISRKAIEQGLITRDQVARMTDHQMMQLIFLPGFSTANCVTNISGRGVGMDVVKTNIEQIGGTIEMHSRAGQGTTFKIKIPLTLAIIPALMVKTGGENFAIPQVSLLELVRLEGDQVQRGIEFMKGAPILRLRGRLMPLVYMDQLLGIDGGESSTVRGKIASNPSMTKPGALVRGIAHSNDSLKSHNIVIVQTEGSRFGLVVSEINDTEEIVVKPLGKQLKGLSLFAGATIMGDGHVSLILDVSGIAKRAGIGNGMADRLAAREQNLDEARKRDEKSAYLLLRHGSHGRLAIPLCHVSRLEEISSSHIEYSAEGEVVQYRHQIIPLIRLSETIGGANRVVGQPPASLHVVVYAQPDQIVGLVVDEILDIVEDTVHLKPLRSMPGLLGTTLIQQRVTDVVDVPGLIKSIGYTAMHSGVQI